MILVFYTVNRCILWTWVCLFICGISTCLVFLLSQASLRGPLWQGWEQKSWSFFSLVGLEFSLLFWFVTWLTSPTPVSVVAGALWFTQCSSVSQAPLRAGPSLWLTQLCARCLPQSVESWLHVPDWAPRLHRAAFCSDSPRLTGSCFRISAHLEKRCNKASTSVIAVHEKALKSESASRLVMSYSFLCPWDFPGKNMGMGCHFLLQGIFPTQGLDSSLLHWQVMPLPLSQQGSPTGKSTFIIESSFVYVCLCEGNCLFFN